MKRYKWEQDQMNHIKDYIARFGHGSAKLARQAKSREKTLARMQESGLTEKVVKDQAKSFFFQDPGDLSGPIIQFTEVSFGYHGRTGPQLYKKIDFGVDLDSRIALVGPNGAGKSTLLKLMVGDLEPTDGLVRRHSHLRIGYYHQHLADLLDLDLSPLQYMMKCFPEAGEDTEQWRRQIGRFGITGHLQVSPIKILSDGIKSRLVFAWLAYKQPHILLLDEPTNHLDLETIDCLADAINDFEGGVVLVSHDFRLISQVAEEIWEVGGTKKGGVTKWDGDILSYKKHLRREFGLDD
jgi:ATP-binding cassette subfamily F protein 2